MSTRVLPRLLITIVSALAVALFAPPAFAQMGDPASNAANGVIGQLLQTGIVGALAVGEGLVIYFMYRAAQTERVAAAAALQKERETYDRQIEASQQRFMEMALKATEVLAKNNDLLQQVMRREETRAGGRARDV